MSDSEFNNLFYRMNSIDDTATPTHVFSPSSASQSGIQNKQEHLSTLSSYNNNISQLSSVFEKRIHEGGNIDINTPGIHSRLIDIHQTILNSDFIPELSDSDGSDDETTVSYQINHRGGADDLKTTSSYTTTKSSLSIPNNSSETLLVSDVNDNTELSSTSALSESDTSISQKSASTKTKTTDNVKISKDKLNRMFFY